MMSATEVGVVSQDPRWPLLPLLLWWIEVDESRPPTANFNGFGHPHIDEEWRSRRGSVYGIVGVGYDGHCRSSS